ncbi:class I SAM-dependent methyltransferase [Novosphingobium clariflavum]|uniref:Eco57I restriction-modification methylase domain-containing protein n=1 Tax=Novosphingobium clariflavum TaxID=2029884 RepID=A0ABV6SB06_9SPHN|nr:Eco57I restriction-modification methylase domain-containing protein [Novosphingobium clariflavum]
MRGELSSAKPKKRHPLDWYVEEGWEWDQIVRAIGIAELEAGVPVPIWDPAAGYGHSGSRLQGWGVDRIFLSDVVNNVCWDDFETLPTFFSADFMDCETAPTDECEIWSNPPYSYREVIYDGRVVKIAEAFVRHALKLATRRVVMILPNKWLAMGKKRSRLVRHDFPPQLVLHFTERPSMPPGDLIHQMGSRAYRGGMIDYCALVWDVRRPTVPGETQTIWLPPLAEETA